MSTKPEPKVHRFREKALSEPQGMGGVRHPMVRVAEGPTIPEGAKPSQAVPHDWRLDDSAEDAE
jgi:hypothetical protein